MLTIPDIWNWIRANLVHRDGATMRSSATIAWPQEFAEKLSFHGSAGYGIGINSLEFTIFKPASATLKIRDTTYNGAVAGTIWHSGNHGAGSGLDADLLDGFSSASAGTASTIARRDGAADVTARTFRTTIANLSGTPAGTSAMAFRIDDGASNGINWYTRPDIITWLQEGGIGSMTVAHYNGSATGTSPSDVTITSVDTAKSFINVNFDLANSSVFELYFLNSTTVRIEHSGVGSHPYAFSVVTQ